jgi:peptide/nickel transport system substrate-binding protein
LAYYSNPEFDSIIDEGYELSGKSIEESEKKFIEAQKILIEEAPSIYIMDKMDVWVANKNLKGFKYNPSYNSVVFFYDCYREK